MDIKTAGLIIVSLVAILASALLWYDGDDE